MVTTIIYTIATYLSAKAFVSAIGSEYPPRQSFHLYQILTHAQGELLKHRLENALVRPRSGFMGLIFGRIFEFSDFSGCRPEFGLVRSGIVMDTRAVFSRPGCESNI